MRTEIPREKTFMTDRMTGLRFSRFRRWKDRGPRLRRLTHGVRDSHLRRIGPPRPWRLGMTAAGHANPQQTALAGEANAQPGAGPDGGWARR